MFGCLIFFSSGEKNGKVFKSKAPKTLGYLSARGKKVKVFKCREKKKVRYLSARSLKLEGILNAV